MWESNITPLLIDSNSRPGTVAHQSKGDPRILIAPL
jgi:hypothetical protein